MSMNRSRLGDHARSAGRIGPLALGADVTQVATLLGSLVALLERAWKRRLPLLAAIRVDVHIPRVYRCLR